MRRLIVPLLFACLLLTAGCQKNFDQKLTIKKGELYAEAEFKAPKKEQSVKVTAGCDVPISVYVILMDDKEGAVRALLKEQQPKKTMAEEEKTKEASFEATIPAGKGFAVLVRPVEKGDKDIEVELKVKPK